MEVVLLRSPKPNIDKYFTFTQITSYPYLLSNNADFNTLAGALSSSLPNHNGYLSLKCNMLLHS